MATKAKEGALLKSKSRSAPTTPSSSSQRKRLGPTGNPGKDATASTQEKPIPNYLRPTISSGQNSKHLQHSESPSKSPITKKPVEKSASPSSQSKDKARSLKSPLPKPSNSPNSASEKASSYKNVKVAKAPTTTSASSMRSISKGASSAGATKRKETRTPPQQVGKILSQDEELKAESSPICDNAETNEEESDGNDEKQEKIVHHAAAEESEAARGDDTGNEALLANSNEEGVNRTVEGANVALVGAFETVMELEGQQSPQKGDKGKNVVGENQHMEEKKAETNEESQYEDEEKKAQGGAKDQEQEEKNNVEIEQHIGEQELHGENVEEEGSSNTAKESTEESGNGINGNGIGEVLGSEDSKDESPKDGDRDSSLLPCDLNTVHI